MPTMTILRCDAAETAAPQAHATEAVHGRQMPSITVPLNRCVEPTDTTDAAAARKLVREALQFLTMLTAPEVHSPRAAAFRKLNAHLAGRCTLGQAVQLTLDAGGALLGSLTAEHLRAYVELRERQLRPEADFSAELILLEHWRQQAGL